MVIRLLFGVLFVISAGLSPALGATIFGTVTDDSGSVEGIFVTASRNPYLPGYGGIGVSLPYTISVESAADGSFIFSDISSGRYYVAAPKDSKTTPYLRKIQLVTIDDDDQDVQVDFHLDLASTVTGTIRNANGELLSPEELLKIEINAHSDSEACEHTGPAPYSLSMTFIPGIIEPDGSYTITGLYYDSNVRVAVRGDGTINLVPEWSTGATSVSICDQTGSVNIPSQGTHIEGVNFQLDSGATIQGRVFLGTQVESTSFQIMLSQHSGSSACNSVLDKRAINVSADGYYTFTGIGPGEYNLHIEKFISQDFITEWVTGVNTDSSSDCGQAELISVTQAAPNQVFPQRNFQIGEGGNISGTVYKHRGKIADSENYVVRFQDSCTTAQTISEVTTVGGSYYSLVLEPGDYYLSLLEADGATVIGWRASSGAIVPDCAAAHLISVEDNHTVSGIDFFLKQITLAPVYHLILKDKN